MPVYTIVDSTGSTVFNNSFSYQAICPDLGCGVGVQLPASFDYGCGVGVQLPASFDL